MVIGAFRDDAKGSNSGSAYIYRVNTTRGTAPHLLTKLVPGDGAEGDFFGYSVAVGSDGLVVVGAPQHDIVNGSNTGAAYVYQRNETELPPQLATKLMAEDGGAGDQFGYSVAVGNDGIVAVGARYSDYKGGDSGSAYVFRLDTTTGAQTTLVTKLKAEDGTAEDHFGVSVAMGSDGLVVVGAHLNHDDKGKDSGSAYLYQLAQAQ